MIVEIALGEGRGIERVEELPNLVDAHLDGGSIDLLCPPCSRLSQERPFFLSRPYLAAVLTQDQTLHRALLSQRRSKAISGFRLDLALIGIKDQWFSGRLSVGHVLLVQRASRSFPVQLTSRRSQALSIGSFRSPRPGSSNVWRGHARPSQLCSGPKSSAIRLG